MTPEKALEVLKAHCEWRRGADVPMCDPKELVEAIELICTMLVIYLKTNIKTTNYEDDEPYDSRDEYIENWHKEDY